MHPMAVSTATLLVMLLATSAAAATVAMETQQSALAVSGPTNCNLGMHFKPQVIIDRPNGSQNP